MSSLYYKSASFLYLVMSNSQNFSDQTNPEDYLYEQNNAWLALNGITVNVERL